MRKLDALEAVLTTTSGRVFLGTLLVLLVTSVAVVVFVFQESRFRDVTEPWARASAELVQCAIEQGHAQADPHWVAREIGRMVQHSPSLAQIDVVGPDGTVVLSSLAGAAGQPAALMTAEQTSESINTGRAFEAEARPSLLAVALPVRLWVPSKQKKGRAAEMAAVVHVLADTRVMAGRVKEHTMNALRFTMIVAAILALAALAFVHLTLVRSAYRLGTRMVSLADEHLPEPVEVARYPVELRPIAEGLNAGLAGLLAVREDVARLERDRFARIERLVAIGRVTAMLAHEIRNPLAGISNAVRVLAEELPVNAEQRAIVDEIQSTTRRLASTLSDLLITARPREPVQARIDVVRLVERTAHLVRPAVQRRGGRVELTVAPATPDVLADEEGLVQVLLNLLVNAQDAISDGGLISVHVAPAATPAGHVAIEIVDDGAGMPTDVFARAGEPFYTTKERGTGLGLAISRDLLAQVGGTLELQSTLNQGTRVRIVLPGMSPRKRPDSGPSRPERVTGRGAGNPESASEIRLHTPSSTSAHGISGRWRQVGAVGSEHTEGEG